MGSKRQKDAPNRFFKRYNSNFFENYGSDSEFNKFKNRTNSYNNLYSSPTKTKINVESFTPYSKIPAIGERAPNFKNLNHRFLLNYRSNTDLTNSNRNSRGTSSKIPIYQSLTKTSENTSSNKKDLKPKHLLRRNTYVVLEPIICVKKFKDVEKRSDTESILNATFTKTNSDIKEKSIVFGPKLLNNNDYTSKIPSVNIPKSSGNDIQKIHAHFNTLNYLLHNLKLSRNTENDLLLPKNNPWLL